MIEQQLGSLNREYELEKQQYNGLSERQQAAVPRRGSRAPPRQRTVRGAVSGGLPSQPSSPDVSRVLLLASLMGIAAARAHLWLASTSTARFTTPALFRRSSNCRSSPRFRGSRVARAERRERDESDSADPRKGGARRNAFARCRSETSTVDATARRRPMRAERSEPREEARVGRTASPRPSERRARLGSSTSGTGRRRAGPAHRLVAQRARASISATAEPSARRRLEAVVAGRGTISLAPQPHQPGPEQRRATRGDSDHEPWPSRWQDGHLAESRADDGAGVPAACAVSMPISDVRPSTSCSGYRLDQDSWIC